ncbi:deoxyribose-phosphate aldolase, partial [Salidesulfovibrio brasiliensis]|uniref:deoxyribose-phosphate aldolase n=1 Tax=Salidesulfovibrio brasiliensis TaxID=221711 RepID=UPI0006D06C0D
MEIKRPLETAQFIDHTLLKADATAADVDKLCAEAVRFGFKTVCVNPVHVKLAAWLLKREEPGVCSVVGFPTGATLTECKVRETEAVIKLGATEVDMVMSVGCLKASDHKAVLKDLKAVVAAAGGVPVKVIIESGLLSDSEIVRACELCMEAGAAFVKTCTGFGTGSASTSAVRLMRNTVGNALGVKASGGIKNFNDARAMLEAGANRLGTS